MKIAQYYDHEQVRLGIIEGESLVPLEFEGSMMDFIEQGKRDKPSGRSMPVDKIRFAPVVSKP